jgi:hypothetical protein
MSPRKGAPPAYTEQRAGWESEATMSTSIPTRLLPLVILTALLLIGAKPGAFARFSHSAGRLGGSAASPEAEAAIRAVIDRANSLQEAAITDRDPSVVRDVGTDRYVREMERTNRDLLNGGVTKIELLRTEWGPIVVAGETAEATTYETWATTTAEGRVVQLPDRNVYRLVQEGGSWKIAGNEHPDLRAPPEERQERPPQI